MYRRRRRDEDAALDGPKLQRRDAYLAVEGLVTVLQVEPFHGEPSTQRCLRRCPQSPSWDAGCGRTERLTRGQQAVELKIDKAIGRT